MGCPSGLVGNLVIWSYQSVRPPTLTPGFQHPVYLQQGIEGVSVKVLHHFQEEDVVYAVSWEGQRLCLCIVLDQLHVYAAAAIAAVVGVDPCVRNKPSTPPSADCEQPHPAASGQKLKVDKGQRC